MAKHTSEGRLTLDEFSQRVEVVLAARTQADLDQATQDLPAEVQPYRSTVPPTNNIVAVFSGDSRRGRWRPGNRLRVTAVFGGVDLDMRSAEVGPEVEIKVLAFMGGVDIVVPEGVAVHLSGFSLFGGKDASKLADVPIVPGSPVIRVKAYPIFGGVSIRSKRSSRRMIDEVRSSAVEARSEVRPPAEDAPVGEPVQRTSRRRDHLLDVRDAVSLADDILDMLDLVFPRPRGARRPGQSRIPSTVAPDGTVTIFFSDVSGFTQLTERLGDHASQRLLDTYFQIVRGQIAAHGGYEVKCHGDEAMVAFADPRGAVRCAVDIQRSLQRYNQRDDGDPLRVHIGMHSGEAIRQEGDFLGRTVILASRITDAAGADEILVSSTLYDVTSGTAELTFGDARSVELQGVTDSQRLYPVLWG
jgi:class 3 adenylate cyclase